MGHPFLQIPDYLIDGAKFKAWSARKMEDMFGVDLRSLAIFRMGMAIIILGDLIIRSTDLKEYYSDAGVLSRISLLSKGSEYNAISIHLWNGTPLFQAILFLIAAVAALGLLVGYRTRWMVFLCWFLTASLHERNVLVCQGGDDYLKMCLFWSLFLPLGGRFSIDRARDVSAQHIPDCFVSWGSFALIMQTAFLYVSTAIFKSRGFHWWSGESLFYALNLVGFAKRPAYLLLLFPGLLKPMTIAIFAFEFFGAFLLFSPIWTGLLRTLGILGFIGLHMGIMLCMSIGPFQWVSITAVIAFLPESFWEHLSPLLKKISGLSATRRTMRSIEEAVYSTLKRIPRKPLSIRPSRGSGPIVLFFLYCVARWDLSALYPQKYPLSSKLEAICLTMNLKQSWAMFSPNISNTSGWFVIPGKLKNGSVVDLNREGARISWAQPTLVSDSFKNDRQRKYYMNLQSEKMRPFREDFGRYLCRSWNEFHSGNQELESLQFVFVGKFVLSGYHATAYERNVLWEGYCSPQGEVAGLPLPSLDPKAAPSKFAKRTHKKHVVVISPYAL